VNSVPGSPVADPRKHNLRRRHFGTGGVETRFDNSEQVMAISQPRRITLRRILQLVAAVFYAYAGVLLINEALIRDKMTTRGWVMLGGAIGLMFLLAVIHLVVFILSWKLAARSWPGISDRHA
jgi:hypothetical protein